jgi:predicted PolB exonuclease-like 3'-5' exonuclease
MSITFDLEAIHDVELGPYEPKEGRSPFPPPAFWQVVCIGVLVTDAAGNVLKLDVVEGETERDMVSTFVESLERSRTQLITFNGRRFDLPVIAARCRRHGLRAPYLNSKEVSYRYSRTGHYDVADVLSEYGAGQRAALDVEARLIGMPGKLGVDGANVAALVADGRIDEVRAYCLADVVQTHAVGLRASLERGMGEGEYLAGMKALIAAIDREPRLAGVSGLMNRPRLLLREGVTSTAEAATAAAAE